MQIPAEAASGQKSGYPWPAETSVISSNGAADDTYHLFSDFVQVPIGV